MFFSQLSQNPQYYFAVIIVVVISICLHELAHGFTAIALGDRTPEETGHITLNPLVHMGTFSLVMLAVAGISWGQMPVDPTRLRGTYGESLVALAGPAMNVLLAAIGLTALGLWMRFGAFDESNHMVENASLLLQTLGVMNLVLAALNVIPVPPLDGSRVLANLVPGFRTLAREPAMSGVFLAVTFAVLMTAGRYLFPWAHQVAERYLLWLMTVGSGSHMTVDV